MIADEVYKYVCHGDEQHIHFASLPDMNDITLTVSSAGKRFRQQAGRSAGSSARDISYNRARRYCPTSSSARRRRCSRRLADCLDEADREYEGEPSYYAWLAKSYRRKRRVLAEALTAACIEPLPSQGGYFVVGDVSTCWSSCPMSIGTVLSRRTGPSAGGWRRSTASWPFPLLHFSRMNLPGRSVRFAFCKSDEILGVAAARLKALADRCRVHL